jgi:hypothetical protein
MAARKKTYAEVLVESRQALAAARLADPGEHFPYKRDAVQAVLDEDRPMGPGSPGQLDGAEDRSRNVGDYITEEIADASEAYVAAQAALLADPSEENKQAYDAATDRLQAARLDHRARRGETYTIGAAARRAG